MISDDENENSTYQSKEDMIPLPEHPKQVFKTEVRQKLRPSIDKTGHILAEF